MKENIDLWKKKMMLKNRDDLKNKKNLIFDNEYCDKGAIGGTEATQKNWDFYDDSLIRLKCLEVMLKGLFWNIFSKNFQDV